MNCPNCGGTIQYIDTYDTTSFNERHIELCCGYCENCNTEYQWKEVYEFVGVEDLEECH